MTNSLDTLFLCVSYVPVLFFMRDRKRLDWDSAIKRHSEALKGIVADLFAMLGLAAKLRFRGFRGPPTGPCCDVRPAESALRRLIVVAARGLVVKLAPSRPMPLGHTGKGGGTTRPSFQLSIRGNSRNSRAAKFAKRPGPRIHFFKPTTTGDHLAAAPARSHPAPPPSTRWPGQRRAPQPQARGP